MAEEKTCCCNAEAPAAETSTRRRGLPTLILIAVIAVICVAFALLRNNTALPQYAPAGTDVVVYVNSAKITATPIFKALEKHPQYIEAKKSAVEELKDSKVTFDDLCDSESCFFVNSKNVRDGSVSGISRFHKAVADKLFDLAAKKDASAKKAKLDGKAALTGDNFAAIALNQTTIQLSVAQNKADCIVTVFKPVKTDLAKAVDTGALISIAYEVKELPAEALENTPENYRKLVRQIAFVTLNLTEKDADLQLALELTFKDEKSAKEAQELLNSFITIGKQGDIQEEFKELAANAKATVNGKVVAVSTSYPEAKLAKMVEASCAK